MKYIAIAGIAALSMAGSAYAGGMAEPADFEDVPEEIVEVATSSSSSAGTLVPLLILAVLIAAASGGGSSSGSGGMYSNMDQ